MRKPTSIRKVKSIAFLAIVALFTAAFFAPESRAEDPTVTATLSDESTEAGQPVELTVEISGATSAQIPKQIDANGLDIAFSGSRRNIQFNNGSLTKSLSCIYTVQADHPGDYTIPAITVSVDGTNLSTKPITLKVTAGGGGNGGGNNQAAHGSDPAGKFAFGEIVVPKQTAYVGEAIPVELRFYFDQRARFGQLNPPDLNTDDFTLQKITDPQQEQVEKDGRNYTLVIYKTAVTPAKSGKLTLGPASLQCLAQFPQRNPPHAPGGMDDFFNNDLFNQMMNISQPQQITVKGSAVDIEVKPLPSTGQPANFAGAVGQFALATEASPLKLNVGDPITLKLKISGRGNFDRVTVPALTDQNGWRSYPATGKFTPDDDVGISGSKTFEMALIPNEKKTRTPPVEFAYFDPVAEKYAVLKGDQQAITMEGQMPVAATPAPQASVAVAATKTTDIQYIMTGPAHWGASFAPLFRKPVFWEAQGIPALALIAFAVVQVRRRKAGDLLAQRLAAWRKEKGELMRTLRREDAGHDEFYDAAIRYIQLAVIGAAGGNPGSIGPEDAVASRPLDAATAGAVQSIFNEHAELRYAGVSATSQKLPAPRRQEVLETLRKFEDASE